MPRQKPAPTEAPKPPEAPAAFAAVEESGSAHRRVGAALVAVVETLPVELALTKLAEIWRVTPDGTARRAIRAAAITLLRRDAPVRAAPPPLPAPEPVEPDPPAPVPAPVPKAGALTTLALEDAARMLLSAQEEDTTPPPLPADAMAALMALDAPDPEASDGFRPLPPPPELHGTAAPHAMDDPPSPTPPKPKRTKKPKAQPALPEMAEAATKDMDAAFAILAGVDDVTLPPPKPALDLSAQFAALEKDGD